MKRKNLLQISCLGLFLAIYTPVRAAEKAPFYQGKTLTVIINFAAGGPTDIEGRVIAKHLAKHIPGNPAVTIQAMGGGGGVTAVNFLGEVAKPDGLTAGYLTGTLFHHQLKEPGLRVDFAKFGFISGVQGVTVSYIRADLPPGIKKAADFVKADRFRAAGLGLASSKDVRFRLSFDLLGLKYDYVTGYNSSQPPAWRCNAAKRTTTTRRCRATALPSNRRWCKPVWSQRSITPIWSPSTARSSSVPMSRSCSPSPIITGKFLASCRAASSTTH